MESTIKCTNPSCNTLIPVPKGAMQVICPNCNTWHLPSLENEGSNVSENNYDIDSSPNYPDYSLPPLSGDNSPNQSNFGSQQSMNPYEMSNTNEDSLKKEVPSSNLEIPEEPKAVGFLVTDSGEHLLLKQGKNFIGRENTDLILADKTVSRKHCVVEVAENNRQMNFTIYDIGHIEGKKSTNGVLVSGRTQRLQNHERIPLVNGSSIRLGNISLTLKVNT